jgi:hypothetical protein
MATTATGLFICNTYQQHYRITNTRGCQQLHDLCLFPGREYLSTVSATQ